MSDEREELLISARCIAQRKGVDTAWERFDGAIQKLGIGSVTARVFKVLESDKPEQEKIDGTQLEESNKSNKNIDYKKLLKLCVMDWLEAEGVCWNGEHSEMTPEEIEAAIETIKEAREEYNNGFSK